MSAPAGRPITVYLDLNHWYALGEAKASHPRQASHPEVLKKLVDQVNRGNLRFPLNAVHYMELTENPRDNHRQEATTVMAVLSRFLTMAPIGRIIEEELARSLNKKIRAPSLSDQSAEVRCRLSLCLRRDSRS